MLDVTLPGGPSVCVQTFDRMPNTRSWFTFGPVWSEANRIVGLAATVGSKGFAAYVLPRAWVQTCDCAAPENY